MIFRRISGLLPTFAPRPIAPPVNLVLSGSRLYLRLGTVDDWWAWRNARSLNRHYLIPWEPTWHKNALNHRTFTALVRRQWRDWRRGAGYALMIFLPSTNGEKDTLIGGVSLSNVARGDESKATLGYWMAENVTGKGLMTEAVRLVCDFAFGSLGLVRLEASSMPHNDASKRVLQKCGFIEEGFARNYLEINGRMADHLLWGRMKPNLAPPAGTSATSPT